MLDIEDAFSVALAAELMGISNIDWKIETKSGDGETYHEECKIQVRSGGIADELWKMEAQSGVRSESVCEKLRANRGLAGSNQRRIYLEGSMGKVKHFHCDICGKSYIAKGHLMAHKIFNHSSSSPIVCKECPICKKTLGFVTRIADLGAHIENHLSDRRRFYCEKCSKSFFKNSSLIRHRKASH